MTLWIRKEISKENVVFVKTLETRFTTFLVVRYETQFDKNLGASARERERERWR